MKYRMLEWLACPACRWPDLALKVSKASSEETYHASWEPGEREIPGLDHEGRSLVDILEGELSCPQCAAAYPIVDSIPRMLVDSADAGPGTGHRWTQFNGRVPEYEENFKDMTAPLSPADFLGKLVLDAGCGFGRHAFYAARYGAEVVAMDSSADAVASSRANCADQPRVHVVQGDLYRPPLRSEVFDIILCMGVLHHLPRPHEGFQALHHLLGTNGRLMTWVYGPRQGTIKTASAALHGAASSMEDEQLHSFSRTLARSIRLFSHTPYVMLRNVPVLGSVVSHLPVHDHHKWPFDVLVADIYDRLRVPVTAYITGEELERWFADEGYGDIQVTRRVRNNESFRGTGVRR
jgi:SAM-dependent methyltransferase